MAFSIKFLERYRANHEWETIQKSRPVKYIRRYPKKNGKGWNYVYEDSWKHPFKALLECFGIGKKKIGETYTSDIKEEYGASKTTWAAHVLEYFINKKKWDNLFSKKEKRDKYKKPETQKAVEAKAAAIVAEKKEPKAKNADKMIINRSFMRKVWATFSVEGQRIDEAESEQEKHDNRSNAMKGNKNARKNGTGGSDGGDGGNGNGGNAFKFSSLTEKEKEELGKKITGSVVSTVESGVIKKTDEKSASKVAQEWVEENIKEPANTFIGDVAIKKANIKDSLAHGFGQDKLDAIPAIKDVLEKGTYLGYEEDSDGATVNNHYFAGKVHFPSGDKIVFCRVHEAEGDSINRFYVHEVFTEDEIKKESSFQTSTAEKGKKTGRPLYSFILQDVLKVKPKPQTDEQMRAEKKVQKSWCYFDRRGNLYFRKGAAESCLTHTQNCV